MTEAQKQDAERFYKGYDVLQSMQEYAEWYASQQQPAVTKRADEDEAEAWNWIAMFQGALSQLVELKAHKDEYGKTPEYEESQPKAWHLAKESLRLWGAQQGKAALPQQQQGGED